MSKFTEQEVQFHFLDEAQEYLNEIESGVIGIARSNNPLGEIDALLRAAHSIKGGSALMGFQVLSDLAHKLEDSLKVLRTRKQNSVEPELEQLLLQALDGMQKVILHNRRGIDLDRIWLRGTVMPPFKTLHRMLGDPTPEDENSFITDEAGDDMVLMLFDSEVGGCLERLETVLNHPQRPCLIEEVTLVAQELYGLSEMLDLPTFGKLCRSVNQSLDMEKDPERQEAIAELAIAEWKRVHAMVMIGQAEAIPAQLDISSVQLSSPTILLSDEEINRTLDALEDICIVSKPESSSCSKTTGAVDTWKESENQEYPPSYGGISDTAGSVNVVKESSAILDDSLEEKSDDGPNDDDLQDLLDFSPAEMEAFAENLTDEFYAQSEQDLDDTLISKISRSTSPSTPSSISEDILISKIKPQNQTIEEILDEPTLIKDAQSGSERHKSIELDDTLIGSPEEIFVSCQNESDQTPETNSLELENRTEPPCRPEVADVISAVESTESQTIRVAVQKLQNLGEQFGELVIERNSLQQQLGQMRNLMDRLNERIGILQHSNHRLRSAYDQAAVFGPVIMNRDSSFSAHNGFDSLEMDHYGTMHLIAQELMETVIQIQEVSADVNLHLEEAEQTTRELSRTTKHLQNSMTQIRMRPISELLNRCPRVLRDLEFQYNKSVNFSVKGGGTLIDRTILEGLNDPLIHLIRNAFDHGIESVTARQACGKPNEGTIEIAAAYRGNQTVITVSDDGGGIALDKVKEKAIQIGISAEQLEQASEKELLELLFEPGFSTAESVTHLSGRGVGMDIVRHNLQKIRGEISIESRPGVGTTFTITVPFNLSVVRSLLIESKNTLLAFPTDSVQEIVILQPDSITHENGQSILNWEGEDIPLFSLDDVLQCPYAPPMRDVEASPLINQPLVLLFDYNEQPVGLQVDRYWAEQEVTVRQVQGSMPLPLGFSGCTILGDGRIAPLVEVTSLLNYLHSPERTASSAMAVELEPQSISHEFSTVMVVEDSVNVRRFLANTLEKSGYHVEQAKDGQHALEKLQAGLSVQAVICDLEMPRLDGFGFLSHVKSDHKLKNIPVMMLTSRSAQKHRNLAKTLGATAYFCKPFREQELLSTLTDIISC